MAAQVIKPLYQEGELIFAFHHSFLYEAKVLEMEMRDENGEGRVRRPYYLIHYQGWKDRWNEWVDHSRMLKHNPVSVQMRKKLQEELRKNKNTAARGKGKGQRGGRKRKATDMRYRGNVVPIDIPTKLQKRLVNDKRLIFSKCLVPLPREPNVAQILDEYKKTLSKEEEQEQQEHDGESEVEVIDGITKYFDAALGSLLLYRFERLQYAEALKSYPDKRLSEIYGAEHLLRLFVRLPELLAEAGIDEEGRQYMKEKVEAILEYINENRKTMLLKEYQDASPLYRRMAQ